MLLYLYSYTSTLRQHIVIPLPEAILICILRFMLLLLLTSAEVAVSAHLLVISLPEAILIRIRRFMLLLTASPAQRSPSVRSSSRALG